MIFVQSNVIQFRLSLMREKISMFLTDPRLRDMSRKSVEADVKRKFDMKRKTIWGVSGTLNIHISFTRSLCR